MRFLQDISYYIMKQITIRAIPNASRNEVIVEGGTFKVRVTAKATDGKVNKAVIEVLADHFGVKKNRVRILKGEKSRDKIVELSD
jgi:uncharacterized protein (TIGR00251 family)